LDEPSRRSERIPPDWVDLLGKLGVRLNPPDDRSGRELWTPFYEDDDELELIAGRVPEVLIDGLRKRALGTTLQLVVEHAITLYLGTRLPPDIPVGPFLSGEVDDRYRPAMSRSPPSQLAVRIPKSLLRWVRVYAAEAEITEKELLLRVITWYLSRRESAPTRDQVERDPQGILYVGRPLLALKFQGYTLEKLEEAAKTIMDEQATRLVEAAARTLAEKPERPNRRRRSKPVHGSSAPKNAPNAG
jgi:hypothetical protein